MGGILIKGNLEGKVNRMKVNKRTKNVREICFIHKGTESRYKCFVAERYRSFEDCYPECSSECEKLQIEFSDIKEIDALIGMLNEFAGHVRLTLGEWRREK